MPAARPRRFVRPPSPPLQGTGAPLESPGATQLGDLELQLLLEAGAPLDPGRQGGVPRGPRVPPLRSAPVGGRKLGGPRRQILLQGPELLERLPARAQVPTA